MGEKKNAYGVLVLKPEGNRPFGTPRHRWNDRRHGQHSSDSE
jgi:hypothetical protein